MRVPWGPKIEKQVAHSSSAEREEGSEKEAGKEANLRIWPRIITWPTGAIRPPVSDPQAILSRKGCLIAGELLKEAI